MGTKKVNGKTKWAGGLTVAAVIAVAAFIFDIEDRYASAEEVSEGFTAVTKSLNALEKRITRGELESSHRYWISVKFDLDRRFGTGCNTCGPSDQSLYVQASAQIESIAIRLGQ